MQIIQPGPLIVIRRLIQLISNRYIAYSLKPGQVLNTEPAPFNLIVPLGGQFGHQPEYVVCSLDYAAVGVL